MKRIIRLSLLMMLIPLFILNVHAEESSIDNDSTEIGIEIVETSKTIEELLSIIPDEYSLDFQEEDSFIVDEGELQTRVEFGLRSAIRDTWVRNGIDTESLTFYVMSYLEDNSIYTYKLKIVDRDTEDVYEKIIRVNYNNTSETPEEDETIPEKEIRIVRYYDLYTFEELEENKSLEEYLKDIFKDELEKYYFHQTDENSTLFSSEEKGYVYVFVNGVLYKLIPASEECVARILVTNDLEEEEILDQIRKQAQKKTNKEIPKDDFYFDENNNVVSKSDGTNYGKVEVVYLEEEEKTNYEYLEGSNKIVEKNKALTVRVNGEGYKIIRVLINNVVVNPNYYWFNETTSTITLKENFLNTLSAGTYNLVVKFSDGDAKTTFTLKEEERVELPKQVENTYTPARVVQTVTEVIKEEIEEVKEEQEEELKEVSKDKKEEKESSKKETVKDTTEVKEKKKLKYIPIIVIVVAIAVGGLGFILYKKSQEEE